jgi:hypothetical protein
LAQCYCGTADKHLELERGFKSIAHLNTQQMADAGRSSVLAHHSHRPRGSRLSGRHCRTRPERPLSKNVTKAYDFTLGIQIQWSDVSVAFLQDYSTSVAFVFPNCQPVRHPALPFEGHSHTKTMHPGSADHFGKLSDKAICDPCPWTEVDTTRSTCSRPIFWHTLTDLWTLGLHVIQGCAPNEGCVAGPSWQDGNEYSVRYIWAQLVVPPRCSKDRPSKPFSKRNVLVRVTYLLGLPMP